MGVLSRMEQRGQLQNPDAFFINGFTGQESGSGLRVDEDSAVSITAVSAGIRFYGNAVGMLPLKLYEQVDERVKRHARSHPVQRLVEEPNPEQTGDEYREMQQVMAVLWGACYAQKVYDGAGQVAELWPLVPWRVKKDRVPETQRLVYRIKLPDGSERVLSADDVVEIRGPTFDGFTGDRMAERFRESLGLSLALERYGARFFGNDATPGVVLRHPGKLGEPARKNIGESWKARHGGVNRAHRLAILEEGMEVHKLSVDPENAQALESRRFQILEVARILNLPPHMLRDLERATFSNIEQQGIELVTYSLMPWLVRWEKRLTRSLLLPKARTRFYFKFNVDGLLRGDSAQRALFYQTMFNIAAYSPNDILELEDRNPVDGGDERFIHGAYIPLSKVGEKVQADIDKAKMPAPQPGEPEPEDDARLNPLLLEPVLRDAAERVVRWETERVRAAVKRGNPPTVPLVETVDFARSRFLPACMALYGADAAGRSLAMAQAWASQSASDLRLAGDDIDGLLARWEEDRAMSFTRSVLAEERKAA